MQVIQQYANGMNPEVPPYLALGELQRRELAQKQMATAQGGQQGPQPSVKEQVEQKAGLMAAQAMQQQQMMQQMAQPRGPMPAPAGVPQPEAQPQPTMMAASGGLARAPVRFDFQHGGIVAFSNGGGARVHPQAELIEFLKKMGLTPEEFTKAPPKVQNEIRDMMRAGVQAAAPTPPSAAPSAAPTAQAAKSNLFRSLNPAGIAGYGFGLYHGDLGAGEEAELERRRQMAPTISSPKASAASEMPPMTSPQPDEQTYVRKAGPTPPAPIADLKALAEQKQQQQQRQQAARPASAAAPGATTPTPENPQAEVARLALDANRNAAKAMTPEEAMAQERKFATQYGLDKPFGEEERGLLAAMKQRQAQYAAGRPSAELGAVLRGFGQGYGGAGAAGERASQETFNADMAHQREMLNAINAINKTNLETGTKRYDTSGKLFGEDQKSTSAANLQRAQTLGQMRNQDVQSQAQMRGQDIQKEVAQINARANAAGRPFNIVEETFNRLKTNDPKKDAAILQNLAKEFAEYKKPGLDMELLKKFEALPGVKTDLETLSALRMIGSPKPETVTRIRQIESRLAAKARDNSIDPARIGVTSDTPVESVGGASKPPVVDFSSLPK